MKYDFIPENCWYKEVCKKYDTDKCDNYCVKFSQMKHLIENSKLPKKLCFPVKLQPPLEDLSAYIQLKDIKDQIKDFVENGDNVYIYSSGCGNGKTTWASKLLLSYFDKIWHTNAYRERGLFIQTTEFLTNIKLSTYKDSSVETLYSKIKSVDLVVWDDIAITGLTNKDFEILFSLINYRINNGLSNIFTGNLDHDKMLETIGPRMHSRIWYNSMCIEFVGEDRRGQK